MGLEGTDSAFGGVAAMDVRRHELEIGAPIFCYGAAVLLASLIVEDLVVSGVATFLEVGHDAVVHRNLVAVMAGLEILDG